MKKLSLAKFIEMPTIIVQKLKIKEGFALLTINAPSDFKKNLVELPKGVKIVSSGNNYNQIHWFVLNKAQMDRDTWISLISFDDTWSTFGSRLKTEADKKREEKPKERPIFDFVDPKTKSVRLPDDLAGALKRNKKQEEFFNTLSFTNKKEYIEWIVTAKREETRNERVNGTVERLGKGWKNPRNI